MLFTSSDFKTTRRDIKTRASAIDIVKSRQQCQSTQTHHFQTSSTPKIGRSSHKLGTPLISQYPNRPITVRRAKNQLLTTNYRYKDTSKDMQESKYGGSWVKPKTQRQSQKDKFIRKLQNNVLKTENNFVESYQIQQKTHKSSRYPKPHNCQSMDQFYNQRDESCASLIRLKTDGDLNEPVNRSRAKTTVKDFSKLVQDNFQLPHKKHNNDYSQTIQLNEISSHIKASVSLAQIQQMQLRRKSPGQTKSNYVSKKDYTARSQLDKRQPIYSRTNTQIDKDTEIYQQEFQQLTNDFFQDWDKMKTSKSQLYQHLRNKLVAKYPQLRKKYQNYQVTQLSAKTSKKRSLSDIWTPALRSSIKISHNQSVQQNLLTVTQLGQKVKQVQTENDKQRDKKQLKEIFKHAFIYSLSRKKHMNEHYSSNEKAQIRQIRHIQQNMNFIGYMKKKGWKKSFNKNIRGINLQKNKDIILELEQEGTPQQKRLKKCLDDAIQTCYRYHH